MADGGELPSGLLLEWQRKLKFKRQEMTLKMKKKKLMNELAGLETEISKLLSKRTSLKESLSSVDAEIIECQRAQADPKTGSKSSGLNSSSSAAPRSRASRSSLPSASAATAPVSRTQRSATVAASVPKVDPGPLPAPPPAEEEPDNDNKEKVASSSSSSSRRSSRRKSSTIAPPKFRVDEKDRKMFSNVKNRMRQYSSKSVRAVATLEDINSQMTIVEGTVEELTGQLVNKEGFVKNKRSVLVRVKNSLALLHGKAETLLYKHIDTVMTSELDSGKADARSLRKSLVRRANNIIESVDKLFGFLNLHISNLEPEDCESESEDDGAASDFEDARDSDFEDAEEEEDVEILYTHDMDAALAKRKEEKVAGLFDKSRKKSSLSKFARVIVELYETEKTYVGCLTIVCDLFLKKFVKLGAMTNDDIRKVFGNIPQLKQLQEQFLAALKDAIGNRRETDRTFSECPIGEVFTRFTPFFTGLYKEYLDTYDSGNYRLQQLMVDPNSNLAEALSMLLKDKRATSFRELSSIQSLLITPIQRLPRYKLLLEQLIKHAPKGHSQLSKLKKALEKVRESASRVNESMTDRQNRIRIFDIQNQFSPPQLLMKPHRRFIKEGVLGKLNRRRKVQKYSFFLFSDIVVYGEKHKGSAGRPSYLEFHRKVHFRGARLHDLDHKKKYPHRFEIRGKEKSFVCIAGSRQDAVDWVDVINQLARERVARRETRQFGLQRMSEAIRRSGRDLISLGAHAASTPGRTASLTSSTSSPSSSDYTSSAERIHASNMKAARLLGIATSTPMRRPSSARGSMAFRSPSMASMSSDGSRSQSFSASFAEDEIYDALDETDQCAAVIDRKAKRVPNCQTCGVKFTIAKRVHNCQRCAKHCCADCNSYRIIVDGEGSGSFIQLKVCKLCKLENDELKRLMGLTDQWNWEPNPLGKHASIKSKASSISTIS